MFFSFKPKPTLLRSPSLPNHHLLLLKVVATTPAEPLRRPPARMTAKERAAREEMSDVEPRPPKTEPWGAPPTLQLARCEGRGHVIVHFCIVIIILGD